MRQRIFWRSSGQWIPTWREVRSPYPNKRVLFWRVHYWRLEIRRYPEEHGHE